MKRHPALTPLSRDHHGALLLARLLQKNAPAYKGLPTDVEGKAAYALNFYTKELITHFEQEEKVLQLVTGVDGKLDLLIPIIIREHQDLHQLFKLIKSKKDTATNLDQLGKTLETHIRKEERELFPLIEKTCSDAVMTTIDTILSPH